MTLQTKPKVVPVQMLRPSELRKPASDIDIKQFNLLTRDKLGIKLASAIVDATIERTIDGASTLTIVVDDDNARTIENSGRLGRKVDAQLDGLYWTLVGVKKNSRRLTLTFEEREVNVLRYYASLIMANRDKVTRAQFVLRMIKEVREISIAWVIPELDTVQKIGDDRAGTILIDANRDPVWTNPAYATQAIPAGTALTVKNAPATLEQINNASTILQTGVAMKASRKVMVSAIMTAIAESRILNLTGGDRDSVGVFQQRPSQGWPASRDIPTDAAAYYQQAIALDKSQPNARIQDICQGVQRSFDSTGSNYAAWQNEAERFVTAFGVNKGGLPKDSAQSGAGVTDNNQATPTPAAPGDQNPTALAAAQGNFFMRGQVRKVGGQSTNYRLTPENSWNCMQRLAQEVNWRCFCVSGTIYFVSEQWLFKSKPFLRISEDTEGIDSIDYDYDEGKKSATVTVTAHASRWSVPPGCIIEIFGHKPINGRWLVESISRSVFSPIATITLNKPLPVLPEPTSLATVPTGFNATPSDATGTPQGARNAKPAGPITKVQQDIIAYAKSQLGLPYRWGAELPGVAFDCSGLTQASYSSVGISIPKLALAQLQQGPQLTSADQLAPADLVFFGHYDPNDSQSIHHVAIYLGDGAIIHAPHTGDVVRVQENFMSYFKDYYGATRPWQK